MTWTYAGSPGVSTAAQRRDLVRRLLGDVVSTFTPTLTDEEIAYFIGTGTSAIQVKAAAIDAGKALLASFARDVDFTRSKISVSASQRYTALKDLLSQLETDGFADSTAGPFLGGSSEARTETDRADTDLRQPMLTVDDGREAWQSPAGLVPLVGG